MTENIDNTISWYTVVAVVKSKLNLFIAFMKDVFQNVSFKGKHIFYSA